MTSRSRIPSYRKHKPSGRAVVTLNGRDIYLGPHGAEVSKAEYDRVVREWLINNRQLPAHPGGGSISVAELMNSYWAWVQTHYVKEGKPTGEQGAIKAALRPVLKLYGHVDVTEFGPQALITCREAMVERGWCRKTVNKHVGRVKRMFAWGTERELVTGSVYHALLAVKGLRRGRTAAKESLAVLPVTKEHMEAAILHVSAQVAAMIRLQWATGMRPGEVVLMRSCDIDRADDETWTYKPMRHKTEHHGHARLVPLGPLSRSIIEPFLDRPDEAFLFDPREAEEARNARRRMQRATPMRPMDRRRKRKTNPKRAARDRYGVDSYRRAVERACQQADVPKWTPHRLRHSAATRIERVAGGLLPDS